VNRHDRRAAEAAKKREMRAAVQRVVDDIAAKHGVRPGDVVVRFGEEDGIELTAKYAGPN
jgi:hypothetical protein